MNKEEGTVGGRAEGVRIEEGCATRTITMVLD